MNLQEQYIQNIRNILTYMVRNVAANPHSPWIQPSSIPLMDGYNRPLEDFDLLAVTHFKYLNHIQTPMFCHEYQRKLFRQPVKNDEKGIPVIKKNGEPILIYPCNIKSEKLNEKIKRMELNRKILVSKSIMRMHLEKISPVNDKGVVRYLYKNISKGIPLMDDTDRLVAEISSALVALDLGLPKIVEPQHIGLLNDWLMILEHKNTNINELIELINKSTKREMGIIKNTEIKEKIFRDNLTEKIKNLNVKDNIPRFKNISDVLTPTIKIK